MKSKPCEWRDSMFKSNSHPTFQTTKPKLMELRSPTQFSSNTSDSNASLPVPPAGASSDPLLGASPQAAPPSTASTASFQAASAGTNDVLYTYYYFYGNGDYYQGYGYADASQGYYAGQYFSPVYDETYSQGYNPGSYYIATVQDYGVDYGAQNQVYVTQYYDAETAQFASYIQDYYTGTYGYGSGYSGLGSELGYAYNYSLTNNDPLFGYQYYEADLTTA